MQITSLDMAMYDLVLGVLSLDSEFYPWTRSRESGGIGPCVLNRTASVEARNIEWTLNSARNTFAPRGLLTIGDILARNSSPVSLNNYAPKYGARLVSCSQIEGTQYSEHCNADAGAGDRCTIRFAAPGYCFASMAACVFFWFDDGSRDGGGTGIYIFDRYCGAWRLSWRHIAYRVGGIKLAGRHARALRAPPLNLIMPV